VQRLGTDYGGWSVPAQLVGPDWVVYCLGAGNDVSFETELIRLAGCEVFSFDPTDASAAHVAEVAEPKLHFLKVAVWNHDGTLPMFVSPLPTSTTLSAANLDVGHSTVEVPCRSIHSLMKEFGHDHIDLLKYHVEGAEYDIFDPGLLGELDVKILGIRLFHTAPPRRALRLIADIRAAGYALLSHEVSAFVFVRRDLLTAPATASAQAEPAPEPGQGTPLGP
jgi:FkbM family methyltransferase